MFRGELTVTMGKLLGFLLFLGLYHSSLPQTPEEKIKEIFSKDPNIEPKNPVVTPLPGVEKCECVPYYLCRSNNTIVKDGTGVIDIRADEGPCDSYMDVCCGSSDKNVDPIKPNPVDRKGCGFRHADGVGFRITGDKDNEAQFGELPWMAAVMHEESVKGSNSVLNVYQCGGALIHPQVVLTAAHCVTSKEKTFKVRAGEWDTQTEKEIFPYQDRLVKTIVIHPEYYAGALFNDVALLIVDAPFELIDNVDILCLPPQDIVIPGGTRCYASGWGKDVFGKEGKYQVILKRVDLPIVQRENCQENLRKTRLGKHFELHKSFVCAGGEPGIDTCKGDGGSPLICPIPGETERFQHIGIVAWGIGCGEDNIPGVYANVGLFRKWIDEQMANHKFDTTQYQY